MTATSKHPLIVVIHGGPHGENGPGFNFKNEIYAAHGYAVLNVNYRGSLATARGLRMPFSATRTATKARTFSTV
jgi:predicted acyl esterase